MHLHFERNANSKCDCPILSLTWMGKVPDELPEDEGWKLNRTNYYQEGWLATGNMRGIVGVTFTTSHCKKTVDYPVRTNYNLRGHRSEVILVKWNEPYQKLASCDSSGIIFVWIKYEGRWSIELINDRNTPVTHFAWSHDGRMALICYNDGFVLVGSVAGQRYWSSMLNLDSTITCGIWTPDDMHVYFGTSQGGLVVMDVHGAMVAQVSLPQAAPVTSMAWSCEKFKMEEIDDTDPADLSTLVLAVCVSTGHIYMMKSYDDVSPIQLYTGLGGPLCMEWSNSRQLLAVAGVANHNSEHTEYVNMLKCYSDTGQLLYSTVIPFAMSPVTALTWGHNDKRLFVATGGLVHIAWVSRRVATLQLLSRLQVATSLPLGESSVRSLPLPPRLKHLISNLFAQTIRCLVPGQRGIREFVSRAPLNGQRLHCTMIRHDDEHNNMGSGSCYTLYLEYLGGLVPLLKGKRTSKIRPEFVIFDPAEGAGGCTVETPIRMAMVAASDASDTEREDGCGGSPLPSRRRRRRRSPAEHGPEYLNDLTYLDTLPESARLVEVTSNIWGTKFKIHGLADCLPANLGQVTYKTSLLHLQPRQMTLVMTELRDDILVTPDPSFNPNVFSEDEDDDRTSPVGLEIPSHPTGVGAIPIAPMTPKNLRQARNPRLASCGSSPDSGFLRARAQQRSSFYDEARAGPSRTPSSRAAPSPLTEPVKPSRVLPPPHPPFSPSYKYVMQARSAPEPDGFYQRIRKRRPRSPQHIPSFESLHRNSRSRSEGPTDRPPMHRNQSFLDAQNLSFQVQTECLPSTSTSECSRYATPQPETPCSTYQSELQEIVKKLDELMEKERHPQLARPESIEDEASYIDFNLNDVISFADNLKLDVGVKPRRVRRKPDKNETCFLNAISQTQESPSSMCCVDPMRISRSCSVGFLDDVDTGRVPGQLSLILLKQDAPKRLFLVRKKPTRKPKPSHSFDSSEFLALRKSSADRQNPDGENDSDRLQPESSSQQPDPKEELLISSAICDKLVAMDTVAMAVASDIELAELPSPQFVYSQSEILPSVKTRYDMIEHAHSQPASPAMSKKKRHQSASPIRKHFLNSPLLRRRRKSKTESSDDEVTLSGDEAFTNKGHYKDLETFQKAQLRQKLKRGKVGDGHTPRVRELVMHNKAPMWNENSQVYQLDFGGRVTQESAKNFQIEFKGKQVMQFGRIDGNAYTLDFQYPFSVLQAFAVALANVTQRLK